MSLSAVEALRAQQREPSAADIETVSRQLGRPARDIVEIGARCVCGQPLVATTAPRLSSGIPFPTTYYLTHPVITSACSRLEAEGLMNTMNEQLAEDAELAADYARAHQHYLAVRSAIAVRSGVGEVPEIAGVSAGGMPERVKCIHALVGHALAAGPGVNPLGDQALIKLAPWWRPDECLCERAWDTQGPVPSKDQSRHVRTQAADPEDKRAARAARRKATHKDQGPSQRNEP